MLESGPVRDLNLERVLTAMRSTMLRQAVADDGSDQTDSLLEFYCALARQCFINEYVFAVSPREADDVQRLQQSLGERLASNARIPPLWPVAVASYLALHNVPNADALSGRRWPATIRGVLTQQLLEPADERELRDTIPRLTQITDAVSAQARRQYEENPYPRWVLAPSRRAPLSINEFLRRECPFATFDEIDATAGIDMLVAGCGTGLHPIGMARAIDNLRVLAIDLSLGSLCYAQRMTRGLKIANIEYAQADILHLATIGRSFDVIDASGVLHHLADPLLGWRTLLGLLRPRGLMRIGLYSELGRRDIVAARAWIAERGFDPTADDIRRCRQELVSTSLRSIANVYDFFSMSECRDLLFHVQEHRLTIPQIKSFLADNGLSFVGFKTNAAVQQRYRNQFPDDRTMINLDHWHAFEQANPAAFAGMYQGWVQKA
jgi:2-polyprenyl-3-methyl-5-hydroxy-6-metoxy-1,4-benzoquinol methylase